QDHELIARASARFFLAACSSAGRLCDVPIEVAARIGIWGDIEPAVRPIYRPGKLNIGPHRYSAAVVLKDDVGASVCVHVAHAFNVPTGPGIAKIEARGVGASNVVAHYLVVNDCQLPDRNVAVVVLEDKVLTQNWVGKRLFCEVPHANYMPSRSGVRQV